jgi:UDP-N-acetylmuramoyl-L-alanyl-D-glutamate--2,6-diaminopimelate ligase
VTVSGALGGNLRPTPRSTSLAAVVERAHGERVDLNPVVDQDGVTVSGITHDSRAVQPGDLYAALPGAHTHGAHFTAAVIAAGAAAILTDAAGLDIIGSTMSVDDSLPVVVTPDVRAAVGGVASLVYGDPSHHMRVIGVTGTNGKTTSTWMVEGALRAAGVTTAVIGTAGVRLGDSVIPSARTTPEAPDLQALLALLHERGADVVAMEVSSHALALHRVDGTKFAVVGFTHLTQDHLDFHGDMESYFLSKQRLFTSDFAEHAVVVVDDEWGRRVASETELSVTTVSAAGGLPADSTADWTVRGQSQAGDGGQTFTAVGPDGVGHEVALKLTGQFNVANSLLALGLVAQLGVDLDAAIVGLGAVDVPGRMEQVLVPGAAIGIVDYAHTPDAVSRAVAAAVHPGRRLVVVLGAGGDRDADKRPQMGAAAAELADVVVVTDDNPRSEDPAVIRGSVASGTGRGRAEVIEVAGRREAIARAVAAAGEDGIVLVLGKGHETGQEIAGVMHPFDDRAELRAALAATVVDPPLDAGDHE